MLALAPAVLIAAVEARSVPREPVEIGNEAQFFIDNYIVDNKWAVKFGHGSRQMLLRVFHAPVKNPRNPLIVSPAREPASVPQPGPSWFSVLRDPRTGVYKMWYQDNVPKRGVAPGPGVSVYETAVCYVESKDGLEWVMPKLGLIEWQGNTVNNVVWRGGSQQQVVTQIPADARRGYPYLMLYLSRGLHLIGSPDGLHWDAANAVKLHAMNSDFPNNVLYDPERREYVMYTRAKHAYQIAPGDPLDRGDSRRIARMASPNLWSGWTDPPQVILTPDELDIAAGYQSFHSMMVTRHAGIFWGFLHMLKGTAEIRPQLAFSRDGLRFDRLPARPGLISLGAPEAWDSGMITTAYQWVETGSDWRIYYVGWDGPYHPNANVARGKWRRAGIGLATIRKEGFISLRGPADGGVIATRRIRWPGGSLFINADAREGELKVRVSDEFRRVIPGFDYKDSERFTDDDVAHEVKWKGAPMDSLKGRAIRLEFYLKQSDLYTFRAGKSSR
jgi:hypothetical protein